MLHRAKVEWPCLSCDILLKDRFQLSSKEQWFPQYLHSLDPKNVTKDKHGVMKHKMDRFPYSVYFCAGSQAQKKGDNKLYVMKWANMGEIKAEEEESEDSQDEDEPVMRVEYIPHKGCVNRVRAMYGTPIVATWNEDAEVSIFNV